MKHSILIHWTIVYSPLLTKYQKLIKLISIKSMYSDSKVILLLLVVTFLLSHTESCCCTWHIWLCGCNIFGCNCDFNGDGYCYTKSTLLPPSAGGRCHIKKPPEKCSDFRYKRSISSVSFNIDHRQKISKPTWHTPPRSLPLWIKMKTVTSQWKKWRALRII